MSLAQSAGMVVTIGMVVGLDLRVDWLVPLATLCGGLTIFVVSLWQRLER